MNYVLTFGRETSEELRTFSSFLFFKFIAGLRGDKKSSLFMVEFIIFQSSDVAAVWIVRDSNFWSRRVLGILGNFFFKILTLP